MYLKSKGPIKPVEPQPLSNKENKELKVKNWPFSADKISQLLSKEKETHKVLKLTPDVSIKLVRIPAGEFIMGNKNNITDDIPLRKVRINKAFWMAEVEITNAQYNAIIPNHDSRYVDQLWKDHTRPGYPANLPEQPVIRISYEDAMEYCRILIEKTGEKVTLPTEEQWEWACRAGSDNEFWFGDLSSDFGKQDNLADVQLCKMAVSGIDPQPMSKTNFWYRYYNFYPKDENVNDGNMLQVSSYKYQPNPFGLYCMHGNIAEWTCSDYSLSSTNAANLKVVRGGSYLDRAKFATSYFRKAYYPWQRVFNVGFRIIIEDK